MEYKKTNCNSYNIHTIKTVRMEIIFSLEVKKEILPIYTFLCDILTDCSKKYQRRKDIAIRLEELYKASFYGLTNKVGNLYTASFVLEFIAPNFINEKDYLHEVLKFPFEIINSSYKVLGEKEDILKITPSSLYEAYLDLFKNNCDIFVIGNINMDEVVKIIKENFKNHIIKTNRPKLDVTNKMRKKVLKVNEPSNFVQSTLVMIYNINNLNKEYKNVAFHVFNYLLGSGGISSKLYKNLRMDNSLCYI